MKEKRPKILLLSDDLRSLSGVGTVAKDLVLNTVKEFDWIQIAAAQNHPQKGKKVDLSRSVREKTGVKDATVYLIPWSGYGNREILLEVMKKEKPDCILLFTDPHNFEWVFKMDMEIRKKIPILYLNIWDNLPTPYFNRPHYESVDTLISISKLTYMVNKAVVQSKNTSVSYLPHGRDPEQFYPIKEKEELKSLDFFRTHTLEGRDKDFVVFLNARNLPRKEIPTAMKGFASFCNHQLSGEEAKKVILVIHTDPKDPNGPDLYSIREMLERNSIHTCDIKFSSKKISTQQLNFLYNMSDTVLLTSSNEGWGLPITEALFTATPFVAPETGGIVDQMGEWSVNIQPIEEKLVGSQKTPYINESIITSHQVGEGLNKMYRYGKEVRKKKGEIGLQHALTHFTTKKMGEGFIDIVKTTLKNFKPIERLQLISL